MMDYYSNTMQQTVDETHTHSASVEKSHLQGYTLYDSMYAAIWKSQNYTEGEKKKNSGSQGLVGARCQLQMGTYYIHLIITN